tara:strand:+ start:4997 stop:5611 length:615 start_codon:yes stop_codon:yes gene_type:complete
MKELKKITVLIDYIGHPSINEKWLNDRRFDALHTLIFNKNADENNENIIVSITDLQLQSKRELFSNYNNYRERYLELRRFAIKKPYVRWIGTKEDITIEELTLKLSNDNYIINPEFTEIDIAGVNLSGCVLHKKQTSVYNFAKLGFKVNILLPMCAEAENSGVNDLERTTKAICKVYTYLKDKKIIDNVNILYKSYDGHTPKRQ